MRPSFVRALACMAFATSGMAMAQGYEVRPWPPERPRPAWEAVDMNGQVWRLSDLRGQAVLINFWATWCEPCRAEMPSLQSLVPPSGPQPIVVLTVNFKESTEVIQRFAQRENLRLTVVPDPQGLMARQWGVTVFPSTVLIGANGRVQSVVRGGLDWRSPEAARLLSPLLAHPKSAQTAQR